MQNWVREQLKDLSRAGELGKRATENPIVLDDARLKKDRARREEARRPDKDAPAQA